MLEIENRKADLLRLRRPAPTHPGDRRQRGLGLYWQRGDAASLQATPAPDSRPSPTGLLTGQPAEPPPRMELEAALELAELNHWDSLRDWCTSLDDAFPECGGFARRVHALLEEIDAGTQTDAPAKALRRLLADRG